MKGVQFILCTPNLYCIIDCDLTLNFLFRLLINDFHLLKSV